MIHVEQLPLQTVCHLVSCHLSVNQFPSPPGNSHFSPSSCRLSLSTMASVPFSAVPWVALRGCSRFNSDSTPPLAAPSWPSIRSRLSSSKSAFLQNGFSVAMPTSSVASFRFRSTGIHARAATEKTLYDFTVKVPRCDKTIWLARFVFLMKSSVRSLIFVEISPFSGWVRTLIRRMFPLANSRGKFFWLSTSPRDGNFCSRVRIWIGVRRTNLTIMIWFSGLTSSNYSELSHIYEKYNNQGKWKLSWIIW